MGILTIGKGQNKTIPDNSLQTDTIVNIHSAHKAALYSALVPGLGQIYNKKYWKLPIIYGTTGFIIYLFDFNNTQYNKFRTAYTQFNNGQITEFEGYTDKATLLRLKDRYQRNRDLNIIVLAAVYILNIVDAAVDAHLFDYNINEDLSLHINPAINKTFCNQNTIGLSCCFSF